MHHKTIRWHGEAIRVKMIIIVILVYYKLTKQRQNINYSYFIVFNSEAKTNDTQVSGIESFHD